MNALLPVAKQMLAEYREFYPFGGTMSPSGEIAHVSGWTGEERPASSELIALLNSEFRDGAAAARYHATALVFDVRVVPPGASAKQDAIAVNLDHQSGYSVVVMFPYAFSSSGELLVSAPLANAGANSIFAPSRPEPARVDNDMLQRFGFGPLSRESNEEEVLAKVREAVLRVTGADEPHYNPKQLIANTDLVYVPSHGIGSAGLLVNRVTWQATDLGSAIGPAAHVWAHYKGFAEGANDLVILRVADEPETQRVLRDIFSGKYYWNLIRPKLRELPFRIHEVNLYIARETLWRAELRGWFEFRVEPPTKDET